MKYNDILYEENDGVATITFNRPDQLNAIRVGMYEEITEAILRAGWNKDIAVIVLTGAGGRAFGVGGDSSNKKSEREGRGILGVPVEQLHLAIRDVPNFPKEGIIFKDISPIMLDAKLSSEVLDFLVDFYKIKGIEAIAGVESRGFLFGYPLAIRLGVPFILIRKQGKLPYDKISHSYDLEYGSAKIEMHTDAIKKGWNVLVHDDLLATGGTACAAAELVKMQGGNVSAFAFIVGLNFLNGEEQLKKYSKEIINLVNY